MIMGKFARACSLAAVLISATCCNGVSAVAATSQVDRISNIIVVYLENHSFDNLLGAYPSANGIAQAANSARQRSLEGTIYKILPDTKGPFDVAANPAEVRSLTLGNIPNEPFAIDAVNPAVTTATVTRGLTHLFYTNRAQIHGGTNDRFAALSNAGGMVMGYYSRAAMHETNLWKAAGAGVLFDNFFQGAFGGSFLNHMWLICSCGPVWPNAPAAQRSELDGEGVPIHERRVTSVADGDYAVNTVQSVFLNDGREGTSLLPAQTAITIGDRLSDKSIDWAWYSEGWNLAINPARTPDQEKRFDALMFAYHHQPFAYFARFDPSTARGRAERRIHLRDGSDLEVDILSGQIPPVAFYKPADLNSEHPGLGSVAAGDAAIGRVMELLDRSPIRSSYALIITYDEFGGFFDHVPPPAGPTARERADFFGPGTRIPAVLVSPLIKPAIVDSTQYETTSVIKFIADRFGLDPIPSPRFEGAESLANAFAAHQK